ncbi:MAG: DUF3021 family protein [Treponema sp.]|jgi:hypothetical protein|nr:DUF3021 family protein [Treponema sp.]MBQ1645086.1 DUF3021 family protein [Treponema sp.]MBQ1672397.1 DUF3021 family protein [Treponema sp.]MBQ1713112.1 DUF3021 family protein [Treponema sp.]MBQ1727602.1 DUF3021 family protein [Treponema sp.]
MKNSENRSEIISLMVNICTRVISLIFLVETVIAHSDWDAKSVAGVLLIGIISGLAYGLLFIKRDMSRKQTFFSFLIYALILNAVLFFIGLNLGWIKKEVASFAKMEAIFLFVFFGVYFITYLVDFSEAKKINRKLKDRKAH